MNTRIAIIDSGVDESKLKENSIREKYKIIQQKDGKYYAIKDDAVDKIGHGTAVTWLITNEISNLDVIMIKIFDDEIYIDEDLFLFALTHCIHDLKVDMIHLSVGITCCSNLFALKAICRIADEKGIIIIAAYDNFGKIAYPAAFKNVIGVDVTDENISPTSYIYHENSDVDIVIKNVSYRIPWLNGTYLNCNGTSFNTCRVTAEVARICSRQRYGRKEILEVLCKKAYKVIHHSKNIIMDTYFYPKSAILFPYNKEMHSFIRFEDFLKFSVKDVYDIKYSSNIGQSAELLIGVNQSENKHIIMPYDKIDWNGEFDTFILGHIRLVEERVNKDYIQEIIDKCLKYEKNLILFDKISNYENINSRFLESGLKLYHPQITQNDLPDIYQGKLKAIGKPILGVFGTSSKQGKFSLQLVLRKYFEMKGFQVGQLGSEPMSLLFGFDKVFPMGYNSSVHTRGLDNIAVLNSMMADLEEKEYDIIIVGSQSQSIPQQTGNLSLYVLEQHEFLYGVEPDAIVLCVNIFDDEEYIGRTIKYLESIIETSVIALVLFPMQRRILNGILMNDLEIADEAEIEDKRKEYSKRFERPVFRLDNKMEGLGEICEEFFME